MTQGYDRREVVKDMNAKKIRATGQADTVPLAPVMSPQPSSFSGVGSDKRSLADAIGTVGEVLIKRQQEREQKQVDDDYLAGQLGQAKGEAEKEAMAKGEWYGRGWLTRKADTMANVLLQQGKADIYSKYSKLSPEEYSVVLANNLKEAESNMGDDPYTKKLSAGIMSDILPKLVSEQVAAHSEFNKQEHSLSMINQLISGAKLAATGDVDAGIRLTELLKPNSSGLPRNLEIETVLKAAEGDPTGVLTKMLLGNPDLKRATTGIKAQANISAVAKLNLLTPTDTGVGTYGISMEVLKNPPEGIVPIQNSSIQEQDRVGREYLELMDAKYNSNPILIGLAKHDGINKVDDLVNLIGDPSNNELSMEKFLSEYDGDEAKEYAGELAVEYTKYEQSPEHIGGVEKVIRDGWSMSQIKRLSSVNREYTKQRDNTTLISNAITNNTVNLLGTKAKRQALELIQSQIETDVMNDPKVPVDSRSAVIMDKYTSELVKMNVVDSSVRNEISLQLTPTSAISTDGIVDDKIITAYNTYKQLRTKGGIEYADKYLTGSDQERFVYNTLALEAGSPESSQSALYLAQLHEQDIRNGTAAKKVVLNVSDREILLDEIQEELGSTEYTLVDKLFGAFTSFKTGTSLFSTLSGEMDKALSSDAPGHIMANIQHDATRLMSGGKYHRKAALKLATARELKKNTVILGNVIRSSDISTLYKDAGIEAYSKFPDILNAGMLQMIEEHGPEYWGDAYGGYKNTTGIWEGIKGGIRGVPTKPDIRYDTVNKQYIINIFGPDGKPIGPAMVRSAELIGAYSRSEHLTEQINTAERGYSKIWDVVAPVLGNVQAYTMHAHGSLVDELEREREPSVVIDAAKDVADKTSLSYKSTIERLVNKGIITEFKEK